MAIPDFFIIGAQKCGTDALYQALRRHPEVYMSPEKEPSYFMMDGALPNFRIPSSAYARRLVCDWDRYQRLFDGVTDHKAIGEASAIYLSSYFPEQTAARICERIPEARLIALVRQPADRAYSAHTFYHARELEPLADFSDALSAELARLTDGTCPDIRHYRNGCYFRNLKPYFDIFPRNQIRVYLFEEWNSQPAYVLRDIFRFLGVDEDVSINVERVNVTSLYRSRFLRRFFINPGRVGRWLQSVAPGPALERLRRWNQVTPPPFPPEIRRSLTLAYRDEILALQRLLGKDLSSWLIVPDEHSPLYEEAS